MMRMLVNVVVEAGLGGLKHETPTLKCILFWLYDDADDDDGDDDDDDDDDDDGDGDGGDGDDGCQWLL